MIPQDRHVILVRDSLKSIGISKCQRRMVRSTVAIFFEREGGKLDARLLQDLLAHVGGTHDLMVFNAAQRKVHIRRTQGSAMLPWQDFELE